MRVWNQENLKGFFVFLHDLLKVMMHRDNSVIFILIEMVISEKFVLLVEIRRSHINGREPPILIDLNIIIESFSVE